VLEGKLPVTEEDTQLNLFATRLSQQRLKDERWTDKLYRPGWRRRFATPFSKLASFATGPLISHLGKSAIAPRPSPDE
jgi:hypothetical protein